MAKLGKVVYLTDAQKNTLFSTGTVTVDGVTITYSDNDLYLTPAVTDITDVKVNGTSVVSQGIANVPVTDWDTLGVSMVDASLGIYVYNGYLYIYGALPATIKAGADYYQPIVPYYQHEAVFYGLAKAAGDSTQSSSSNAVGTYTTDAQTAINTMIGSVNKAGDTITGTLNLTSNLVKVRDYGSSATSLMYVDTTENVHRNVLTTSTANVFGFRQYNKEETSPALAAGTYYEGYLLPSVSTGLTGNQSYNIITDKPGEQFVYKASDTFTTQTNASNRPIWAGIIASDSKAIYLTVIVDKSLSSVSSATVTTLTGWIYGVGGAIESSTTTTNWVSNYTCTAVFATDHIVRIKIAKTGNTAFSGVTASTPVMASLNTVLTFA